MKINNYYWKNREKILARTKEYHKENRLKRLEYNKEYRNAHKEHRKEINIKWRKENKENLKEYEKNRGLLSRIRVYANYHMKKEKCCICGSKDRLEAHHTKGYKESSIKGVVILCKKCHAYEHSLLKELKDKVKK